MKNPTSIQKNPTHTLSWIGVGFLLCLSPGVHAQSIRTNSLQVESAPAWVNDSLLNSVTDSVERALEWDIRKTRVIFYSDVAEFKRAHSFSFKIAAFSRKSDSTIHLGPEVQSKNFKALFGHELVHIVLFQKYKDAIPKWLEEGLANYVAKNGAVNYRALAQGEIPPYSTLSHPGQTGVTGLTPERAYGFSTALIEMIASRCNLPDLLQLSVGKSLETYLTRTCGLSDLNRELKAWVGRKGRG